MKTILSLISALMLMTGVARSQTADPYLAINANPAVIAIDQTAVIEVRTGNAGNDAIVRNSLRITISIGSNAEITGLDPSSDPRWTVISLTTGTNNTIRLTNNTPGGSFADFDLADVFINTVGTVLGGPSTITGNISYIAGANPELGGAPSASQGNQPANDNSTTSLTVTSVASVKLKSIFGATQNCNANLSWITASEENFNRFDVELSRNAKDYITVGSLAGKNIANGAAYQFSYDQGKGRGYYRLKMINNDGSYSYSKILILDPKCNSQSIKIHPNPVIEKQLLTVNIAGYEGTLKGELLAISGQLLRTYSMKNGTNTLPIENITQGTYLLRVTELASGAAESFSVIVIK
jgi:hypothetical protein